MPLDANNALDVTMEIEEGQVVRFALNYRAYINGRWVEVVRYDTAHGHLHVHENWKRPDEAIRTLEGSEAPSLSYGDAFQQAEADLKANWRRYRQRMERRIHDV